MNGTKYVAMDVHTATISVAVLNSDGKLIMESVIEAKRSTIVQFMQGLHGELFLTFEEGTWSAWLYDLLTPYVTKIVVCDPRRNALLKQGSANDRIDARKLAEPSASKIGWLAVNCRLTTTCTEGACRQSPHCFTFLLLADALDLKLLRARSIFCPNGPPGDAREEEEIRPFA